MTHVFHRWLKSGLLMLVLVITFATAALQCSLLPAQATTLISRLPAGNAITDGRALLRYALPIDNEPVRQLQESLEDISTALRTRRRLNSIRTNLTQADRVLSGKQAELLASVPDDRKTEASFIIAQLEIGINAMRTYIDEQDKESLWIKRAELLDMVGALEELMVQGFPYEVPADYANLPQLKGRATVAMETERGSLTIVVDGYSAPVTGGNFVDLVQRGFYDGLPVTRAEDFYVVQLGDPPGDADGFIDPKTKEYRAIPLEVLVKGDEAPTYGITLEDAGRFLEEPVLPFSAYGALAMARPGDDPNGGSSQFFFFLYEAELTPAGANLLDGRYSVFGYVVNGKEVLSKLKAGDRIISATVVSGLEHLVQPQS
ncbi:MAG: peptidylprolyl isomerase [Kaiparowitsia implicata GSE-PSE-MK54-09C]|jgi:peptidylprolyl isomerase|nr:peptidylprolyl isomerase [Kaiparowitsia implicata GSE-PSE-MK54-09C]